MASIVGSISRSTLTVSLPLLPLLSTLNCLYLIYKFITVDSTCHPVVNNYMIVPLSCVYVEGEGDAKGSPVEQDETLLDNWIKELESGIQGMADLTGVPAEVNCTHRMYKGGLWLSVTTTLQMGTKLFCTPVHGCVSTGICPL